MKMPHFSLQRNKLVRRLLTLSYKLNTLIADNETVTGTDS